MLKRQREGIAKARADGRYKCRRSDRYAQNRTASMRYKAPRRPRKQEMPRRLALSALHASQTSRQRNDGDGATCSEAWDSLRPSWT